MNESGVGMGDSARIDSNRSNPRMNLAAIYKFLAFEKRDKFTCARMLFVGSFFSATGLYFFAFGLIDDSLHRAILTHGIETKARILHADKKLVTGKYSHTDYFLEMSWRDYTNHGHATKTQVSQEFWQEIVSHRIAETPIKYLKDGTHADIVLPLNSDFPILQDRWKIYGGLSFIVLGIIALYALQKRFRANLQSLKQA